MFRRWLTIAAVLGASSSLLPAADIDEAPLTSTLSEAEYSDLKAYANKARSSLIEGLDRARTLNGPGIYDRLRSAIKTALEETNSRQDSLPDIRDDRLLFRTVLVRTLELESVFKFEHEFVAGSVLLYGVQSALNYYELDDKVRLDTPSVPRPDWAKFAVDQIPALIKLASLAPSEKAACDAIKRALGWVAIDLNRSLRRREHAKTILRLQTSLKMLEKNSDTALEALELLAKTSATLGGTTAAKDSFPISSYPSSSTIPDRKPAPKEDPIFPLVSPGTSVAGAFDLWDGPPEGKPPGYQYRVRDIEIQLGPGYMSAFGHDGRHASFAALNAAAQTLFFSNQGAATNFAFLETDAAFTGALGGGERKTAYSTRGNASLGAMWLLAGWAGFEANDFSGIKDTITRIGWNLSVPVSIGGKNYVFVRLGAGAMRFNRGPGDVTFTKHWTNRYWSGSGEIHDDSGMSYEAQMIIRIARFLINIKGSHDVSSESQTKHYSAFASLTAALGAIFPNDAIRIEGQLIRYDIKDTEKPKIRASQLGAFYEVRF